MYSSDIALEVRECIKKLRNVSGRLEHIDPVLSARLRVDVAMLDALQSRRNNGSGVEIPDWVSPEHAYLYAEVKRVAMELGLYVRAPGESLARHFVCMMFKEGQSDAPVNVLFNEREILLNRECLHPLVVFKIQNAFATRCESQSINLDVVT